MEFQVATYRKEATEELEHILSYWIMYTVDNENGGYYGKVDHKNKVYKDAPKGAVLNSRILWAFSAAFNLTNNETYLPYADRAFQYIVDHFIDKEAGGVYWSVDAEGNALDTKKQIYALSFAVYALSEYYLATGNALAKRTAKEVYEAVVQYSYDSLNGGYIEALTKNWQPIADLRLSDKDANEKKSMNTHLHLLEGFANLYRIWPDEGLKGRIKELIRIFFDHIIHPDTNHLVLFFDEQWNARSNAISYGHDIEAAWLVQEAAEIIGDEPLIAEAKRIAIKLTEAAAEGLDNDGGLWNEKEGEHLVKEKHWWPQAEAMVGFFNAGQLTGKNDFFKKSVNSWSFIKKYILNKKGEWVWGLREDYSIMEEEDKAGFWKCPYHNGRACMEIMKRSVTI